MRLKWYAFLVVVTMFYCGTLLSEDVTLVDHQIVISSLCLMRENSQNKEVVELEKMKIEWIAK